MTFSRSEVDQATTSQEEDASTVGHEEFLVVLTDGTERGRLGFQVVDLDLAVVVAGVAHDGAVLHGFKMTANDDVLHSGRRAEDVAKFGGLVHGHHTVAFHDGSQRRQGVDFGDDDVGAHAAGTHGHPAAAMTVASDDEGLASEQDARRSQNTVKGGLAGPVDVVKVPLGHGVVNGDDGVAKVAGGGHGSQAVNTGGGFFRAPDDTRSVLGFLAVNANDEVGPVVEGERWLELERLVNAPVEVLGGLAVPGMDGIAFTGEPCSDFILRGKRVAARPRDVGTGGSNGLDEHRRFFGHVKAAGHAHTGERLGLLGFFLELGQHRHAGASPIHQKGAGLGESHVANGVGVTLVQVIHDGATCPPLLNSIARPRRRRAPQPSCRLAQRRSRTLTSCPCATSWPAWPTRLA